MLVALDVLLEERSVSLAADRLCLSQSATSSALGRLREYFHDDLLVLKGRKMVLTSRAEDLIDPVRDVLEQIRTTIALSPEFDHEICERQIRIMASDYSTEVLLTEVFKVLATKAPKMKFEIQTMVSAPIESLERGMIDLLLTVDFAISSEHPSVVLFEDDYVVVGDSGNQALKGTFTPEDYFSLGHVTTRFGKSRIPAFDDWFIKRQTRSRRVEVVAPTFLSLPGLIIGTERIATMHRKLADRVCGPMPLVQCEVPFPIPPIREAVQWHTTSKNDFAIQWVIGQLRTISMAEFTAVKRDSQMNDGARIGVEYEAQRRGLV